MSIRFIGHHDFTSNGKFLWEILCQLKSMGVGRYVTKSEWMCKWPDEASYLRIIGARPSMDRWLQKGRVWGEWTFRGNNLGIYELSANMNRADWVLIHKHEEAKFLESPKKLPVIAIPASMPIPPLQKRLASKWVEKYKVPIKLEERTALDLCIDPQFEFLQSFIKRFEPRGKADSTIYDEVDKKAFLDLYGKMLPVKLNAWSTDPARYENHFGPNK